VIATIALGLAFIALLAFHAYREREHDRERCDLLDRVQAPDVAQIAALERVSPRAPAAPHIDGPPVLADADLQLAALFDPTGGT
jgi:hypothetical protein